MLQSLSAANTSMMHDGVEPITLEMEVIMVNVWLLAMFSI